MLKTGRNLIEIPQPEKTYVLLEIDKKELGDLKVDAKNDELFTNDIDKWIEALDFVIQNL